MDTQPPTLISATQLQRMSGQLLRRTARTGEQFLIERDGIPTAALIPLKDYERLAKAGTGASLVLPPTEA